MNEWLVRLTLEWAHSAVGLAALKYVACGRCVCTYVCVWGGGGGPRACVYAFHLCSLKIYPDKKGVTFPKESQRP